MKTRRVGIYVRVSTTEQDTEAQEAELREYAERRGWSYEVYRDKGQSGAKSDRPELTRLLSDLRKRKLDIVVVWALDRLAHSLRQLLEIAEQCQSLGVDLVSLRLQRPRLYARTLALGRRAGVGHGHPHRFRDTLAVDLLCAGAGIYDVARTLSDTVETTERHYAPFVPALRDRLRRIVENGNGLESMNETKLTHSTPNSSQVEENVAAGPVSRILSALRRDGHSSGPRIAAPL